jgi:hypothetical protein
VGLIDGQEGDGEVDVAAALEAAAAVAGA